MAMQQLKVRDASGNQQVVSVTEDALNSSALVPVHALADAVSGVKAEVNADGALRVSRGQGGSTYAYSINDLEPVATPTAMIVAQGSATKTVAIKRVEVSGIATAAGNMKLVATRRSTAGTLGDAVLAALSAAKHDSASAAATAVVSSVGTANYTTLGTTAGELACGRVCLSADGSGLGVSPLVFDFSDSPVLLRGVAEFLTIDGDGDAVPSGGKLDVVLVTEEF